MTSMLALSTLNSTPVAPAALNFIPDSNQALSDELTRLAGHINAAQYRFLKLLAALIERNAWGGDSGMKTPAHWLNYYCGIDLGAAREKVRVAKALAALPQIDEAFASGAISYSKVRAMTRCTTPDNQAAMLNVARHGTAQHVEKLVRLHQRVLRLDKDDSKCNQTRHQARELTWYFDEDGMLVLRSRFAPEEGAVLVKALEAALDILAAESTQERVADISAETSLQTEPDSAFPQQRVLAPEASTSLGSTVDVAAAMSELDAPETTFPRKRADALVRMAEQFLACGEHAAAHSSLQSSCQRRPPLAMGDKYQVVVHFDIRSGSAMLPLGMPVYLEDGPPLSDSTFKRLACDASLVPVLRDDSGGVLNIGRKTRAVSPALRRALRIRDVGCRHPGCCQTRHVDAHHIRHWCDGGETNLDNLVLLCRHHHRLLHENVFRIVTVSDRDRSENDNGDKATALQFLDKQGKEIKPALWPQFAAPLIDCNSRLEIEKDNARRGLAIDAETAITLWQGERMDYRMAIGALMQNERVGIL